MSRRKNLVVAIGRSLVRALAILEREGESPVVVRNHAISMSYLWGMALALFGGELLSALIKKFGQPVTRRLSDIIRSILMDLRGDSGVTREDVIGHFAELWHLLASENPQGLVSGLGGRYSDLERLHYGICANDHCLNDLAGDPLAIAGALCPECERQFQADMALDEENDDGEDFEEEDGYPLDAIDLSRGTDADLADAEAALCERLSSGKKLD